MNQRPGSVHRFARNGPCPGALTLYTAPAAGYGTHTLILLETTMFRTCCVIAALMVPVAASAQPAPAWSKDSPSQTQPGSAPSTPANAAGNSGKVLESQNAGGYTYLNVDAGGQKVWVAVPEVPIQVGANVQWAPGPVMQNFFSKTLNKTFPRIVFSSGAQVVR